MKHVLAAALFVCPLFAAPVTITGTIRRPDGSLVTGIATIELSVPCIVGGSLILDRTITVGFSNGAFSKALEPTTTCPSTTYYRVRYRIDRVWSQTYEYWSVPPSPTTTTLEAVRIDPGTPGGLTGSGFQRVVVCTGAGTATAATCAPSPPLTALTELTVTTPRTLVSFTPTANNTGALTLAISGLTATSVVKYVGGAAQALAANDLRAATSYILEYDGTNFVVKSLLGNGGSGESTTVANSGASGASVLKTGTNVTGRKLVAGSNVTITENTDDITIASSASGTGDVVGPSSATADYIVVFDGTTGKLVKMSGCKIVSSVLSCGDGTTQSLIELPELTANGSNKQSIYGAASQSGDGCVVWPVGNPTSGQVLTDSGSSATIDSKTCRVMSWTTPSGGSGGGPVCSLGADETITASGDFPTASCSITGLTAGKIIRVKAHGVANNASDVSQGFFRLKLNGTNASAQLSSGANGTGCLWTMEFAAEVESAGASAAIDTYGNLAMEATPGGATVWKQGRQSSTINTTSAVTVRISGIPNGTSPSLTLTHLKVWVE